MNRAMQTAIEAHRRYHKDKHRRRVADQLIEECGELITEVCHANRGREAKIMQELADVHICVEFLRDSIDPDGTKFESSVRSGLAKLVNSLPLGMLVDSTMRRCPTCGSHSPKLHPALQHEGEVQQCQDRFHRETIPGLMDEQDRARWALEELETEIRFMLCYYRGTAAEDVCNNPDCRRCNLIALVRTGLGKDKCGEKRS